MGCVYMELYQFLMEYLHTYNIFSIIFLKILTNVKGDKALGAQKNGGKGFTLRQKMVFIMLPVIIIFNLDILNCLVYASKTFSHPSRQTTYSKLTSKIRKTML